MRNKCKQIVAARLQFTVEIVQASLPSHKDMWLLPNNRIKYLKCLLLKIIAWQRRTFSYWKATLTRFLKINWVLIINVIWFYQNLAGDAFARVHREGPCNLCPHCLFLTMQAFSGLRERVLWVSASDKTVRNLLFQNDRTCAVLFVLSHFTRGLFRSRQKSMVSFGWNP